ncbi:MAG: hypothetical protein GX111_08035 [Clostridiales bacterium]|nr:hypothetical protein [Clostridiales bacterium]
MTSLLFLQQISGRRILADNSEALASDLNLEYIVKECAKGDAFIAKTVREILLTAIPAAVPDILRRQEVILDTLCHEDLFRSLYAIISEHLLRYDALFKKNLPAFSRTSPVTGRIRNSVKLAFILLECVSRLKSTYASRIGLFGASALTAFFTEFSEFYSDMFLKDAEEQLKRILLVADNECVSLSAGFGFGMKAGDVVIRCVTKGGACPDAYKGLKKKDSIAITGIAIQSQVNSLRDGALQKLLRIVNDISDTTLRHLKTLRYELAFFLGAANLYHAMVKMRIPIVFPTPREYDERKLSFEDLMDLSLGFINKTRPVGNSLCLDDRSPILVTGANQGGKSTFLRSVGIAQLMMQSGLFVAAAKFSANCCDRIFTHFCRMDSDRPVNGADRGKLDAELMLMKKMIGQAGRNSMFLMNESFSSSPEAEAALIGCELLRAFHDLRLKTIYVTHFYSVSSELYEKKLPGAMFLAAKRNEDGSRPYMITTAAPSKTSFGLDIFREVFCLE